MDMTALNTEFSQRRVLMNYFGEGVIRKVYEHPETKELVCDVKAKSGEDLHLSVSYARRVLVA